MEHKRPLKDKTNKVNIGNGKEKEDIKSTISHKQAKEERKEVEIFRTPVEESLRDRKDAIVGISEKSCTGHVFKNILSNTIIANSTIDIAQSRENLAKVDNNSAVNSNSIRESTSFKNLDKSEEFFDVYADDIEYAYTYNDYLDEHIEDIYKETELTLENITSTHFKI